MAEALHSMASRLVLAGVLCCVAGCTDTAVVGVNLEQTDGSMATAHDGCEPACDGDELCHPELHICVHCVHSNDCADDTDAPFCDQMRFACVQCRSSADCNLPAPRCDQGTCRTCDEPPNCVGEILRARGRRLPLRQPRPRQRQRRQQRPAALILAPRRRFDARAGASRRRFDAPRPRSTEQPRADPLCFCSDGGDLAQALTAVGTLFVIALSTWASAHAILHKREVHASISWAALIWLAPVVGAVAYFLFGRNRIRRRAVELRRSVQRVRSRLGVAAVASDAVETALGYAAPQLAELARLVEEASAHPLLPGNHITPLIDGDQAYPEMLQAIAEARHSIAMSTYIFEGTPIGMRFVDALAAANARGVQVRVLIDDAGAFYSLPPVDRRLRARGVRVARFLPMWRAPYFNLRDHRKLLVVDGSIGFTGGMNIRAGHVLGDLPRFPIRDLHFRVEGPVVAQMMEAFAEDWDFTARESLHHALWFPPLGPVGSSLARAIPDGPDQDLGKILSGLPRRHRLRAALGARADTVLPARSLARLRAQSRRHARRASGHRAAAARQPAARAMGDVGTSGQGARARLPRLAHAAAVRPLQADGRRRPVVRVRFRELGSTQLALELRDRNRVLRRQFGRAHGRADRRAHRDRNAGDSRRARAALAAATPPRRDCTPVHAVLVNGPDTGLAPAAILSFSQTPRGPGRAREKRSEHGRTQRQR